MKRLITICAMFLMCNTIAWASFDNPNYTYTKILDVGNLFRTAESQFSPDGTKNPVDRTRSEQQQDGECCLCRQVW